MANLGTYCNGDPYIVNPAKGPGVRITAISPASEVVNGRVMHGAMRDYNGGVQGFDSVLPPPTSGTNEWISYDAGVNIDPGATSAPIEFGAGVEGVVLKAASTATENLQDGHHFDRISRVSLMTVCAETPLAGAFRPPVAAPAKISHWTEDDLDLTGLRNLAMPVSGRPNLPGVLENQRWPMQAWHTNNPHGQSVAPYDSMTRNRYGSAIGGHLATALLVLNCDIDPVVKRNIAVAIAQRGIDVFGRVKIGGDFNNGNGGHSLRGLYCMAAAALLGDKEMLEYCIGRHGQRFVEQTQYGLIDAADLASTHPDVDYPANSLGGPEWKVTGDGGFGSRRGSGPTSSYRQENSQWQIGACLAFTLMDARHVWNSPVIFDYCDRIMDRRFFPTSGAVGVARSYSGHKPAAFHIAMWDAYRTAPGMPPVWDWA